MEKFFEAQAKAAGKQDVDSDKDNGDTSGSSDNDSVDPRMANDPFCSEESEDFDQFCDGEFEFADDRCEKFAHKIGIALIPKAHRLGQFVNLREKLRKMEEERDRKNLLAALEDKENESAVVPAGGQILSHTDDTDSTGTGGEIVGMNITEQSSATPNVAVAPLEVVAAPCLEMVDQELQVCELQALEEVPSAVPAKDEDPCSSTSGEQVVEEVVDEVEDSPEVDHDSDFEQWVADSMRNYDERDSDSTSSSSCSSAAAPNQDHDSPLHDHEVIDFRGEIVVQEKSVPVIDEEDQRGETIIETRLKQLLGEADFEVYCKDMQELLDRKLLMDEMKLKTGPPAGSEQEEEVEQDESTKLVAFVRKALKPRELKILRQICKLEKGWRRHLREQEGGGRMIKPREPRRKALGVVQEDHYAGPATLMIEDTEDSDSLLNSPSSSSASIGGFDLANVLSNSSSSSSASTGGFDLANRTSSGDDDGGNDAINYDEDFWSSDYDFGFEHQNVFEDSIFSSPAESVEIPGVQQDFLSVVQKQTPTSSSSSRTATAQLAAPSSLHAQKGSLRLPVPVNNISNVKVSGSGRMQLVTLHLDCRKICIA